MPHAPPDSFFTISSPEWYLVRSTDYKAPCYAVPAKPKYLFRTLFEENTTSVIPSVYVSVLIFYFTDFEKEVAFSGLHKLCRENIETLVSSVDPKYTGYFEHRNEPSCAMKGRSFCDIWVLALAFLGICVFWNVPPWSWVLCFPRFEGSMCLHLQDSSSSKWLTVFQGTWSRRLYDVESSDYFLINPETVRLFRSSFHIWSWLIYWFWIVCT